MIKKIILVILLSVSIKTVGQEQVTLTTPEVKPSTTFYRVERITATFDNPATTVDEGLMYIQLLGQNGESVSCIYSPITNPTGTAINNGLNKANLSTAYASNVTTGSLKQRIFHRLVAMNEAATVCSKSLTGTLAGSIP